MLTRRKENADPDHYMQLEGCDHKAQTRVQTVLGVEWYCRDHAHYVAGVEREWDRAEAKYLEQINLADQ